MAAPVPEIMDTPSYLSNPHDDNCAFLASCWKLLRDRLSLEETAYTYGEHCVFAEKTDTDIRYWVFVELVGWTGACQTSFMFHDVTWSSERPREHEERYLSVWLTERAR
jgi:hypothetical protein